VITIIGGTSKITLTNFYAATNPTKVRRIATQTHAIYLAYAQPLIDQMGAIALAAPASVPSIVTSVQGGYWWQGGLATPMVTNITLVANEDMTTSVQAAGAIDHDENITGYAWPGGESRDGLTQCYHRPIHISGRCQLFRRG
jgi:hypothetical protein